MRLGAILSSSLTAVAGAIRSANIYCFWFKFRCKCTVLAYRYALLGATDKQLAVFFDVSESTINLWKLKHPRFSESIRRGKVIADSKVAESLYRRALGYTHSEHKIFQYKGKIIRADTIKRYPPDTQAASLWLRNRQPTLWRDKTDITVKVEQTDTRTTQQIIEAIEEREQKIKLLESQL